MRSLTTRIGTIRHRRHRRLVLTLLRDTGWALALLLLLGVALGWLLQLRGT